MSFTLAGYGDKPATLGTDTTTVSVNGTAVTADSNGVYTTTLAAGSTGFTVTVQTVDDSIVEFTEGLTLSAKTSTQATAATATGSILDNDNPVVSTITPTTSANEATPASSTVVEGNTLSFNGTEFSIVRLRFAQVIARPVALLTTVGHIVPLSFTFAGL